jgi:RNA polymerase sigma-70 factor (ECF subfamily)
LAGVPYVGRHSRQTSEATMLSNGIRDAAEVQTGEFVRLLVGIQSRLYAYICSLIGGANDAFDVLQETNVVLWDKADEYDPSRPFAPWAYQIAYFQVMAYRKRCERSRLVFDEGLMSQVAEEFCRGDGDDALRLEALALCMEKLPASRRDLLDRRYRDGESIDQLARRLRKAPNVVSASLYRVRKALLECIKGRLAIG